MSKKLNNGSDGIEKLKTELQELKHSIEILKATYKNDLLQKTLTINTLKENNIHSLNLYHNAPVNYQSLDSNSCFNDVNPSWLKNMGYSRDQVIGRSFTDFMPPDSAELFKTQLPGFLKSGTIQGFEFDLLRKDGTLLNVSFEGHAYKDAKGTESQISGVWMDITRQHQVEEANHVKDLALESSINGIAISDLDGILTYVNPAFLKMWGYDAAAEVTGKAATAFWHAREKAIEVVEAIQKNGGWFGDLVASNKSGELFDVHISASLVKDFTGKPLCMLASFADISESKQAEIMQAASEISYRELFNNVADAIYIQDKDGNFVDVNEGVIKMYGYPREVMIGKNALFVAAPGKNDIEALTLINERANAGEPQQFEFWGQRANGEIFPKEVRIVSGTYFGEKAKIAIAQDITERKLNENALQKSEQRFRELIELAVDGIISGSPEGIIVDANTYLIKLTGRSLKNLKGLTIDKLFSPDSLQNKPLQYDLLKKGKTVISERDILRPDGTIVPIEMHTKMMPDGTYQSICRDITERKKTQETLRQKEEKYKSLVESTSDILWETNLEAKYTYVSPQFENILGYTPEETIGKSPFDFISENLPPDISSDTEAASENTAPFNLLVNKFRHKNGNIVYFETSGVPVYDPLGKLTGYRGVSRDISKRYLAEKELHKLSAVVQQSPNTVIITNLDGKIEYINPTGCRISGYNAEEVIGKSTSIFKSGTTPEKDYKSLWRSLKAGKEWKGVFCNRKKNGEFFYESASILPIKDTDGKITHYLGIKEDITHRLKTEAAIKESEERYRELFEASPDAIILADMESGMLIDANTAACKLLGCPLVEIRKMHQSKIHPSRIIGFPEKPYIEYHNTEKGQSINNLQPVESIILSSNGSEIPVEVVSNTITINGRNILQSVFRNITDRIQTREELLKAKEKAEASDKLKSAFLQNITHELRTPLNGIIGFSEMITQMDSSEEDRIEFNKMIKKSSTRLINTITSYMDISMIVTGITEINRQPFIIQNLLNAIISQTIDICNSRNLQLEIKRKIPHENIQIVTDEVLLSKTLSHIIDNAIKFTKKGSVTISYDFTDGFHNFSVSDTGTGIPDDVLPLIFDIFRQADLSASREYEGSGLGLSIAHGFVKLLGGEMRVETTNNEGSTFYFSLPEKASSTNEYKLKHTPSHPRQQVVLVAEDDDSNYKYIEILLKKASFKVLRSNNGLETIEICRNVPQITILLTDMKMPGMDGLESTRQIRKMLPQLPIIALSGLISSEDENAARLAGCNDYIIKPVSKTKLLETINKVLLAAK